MLNYLREAETLAETLGDYRRLGWVSAHIGRSFWLLGDQDRALEAGERALAVATALGDSPSTLWRISMWGGPATPWVTIVGRWISSGGTRCPSKAS